MRWSAAGLALALVLGTVGGTRAHQGGPTGPVGGDLSFGDPSPAGIGYEWTVRMHRKQSAQMVHAVGAKSWNEPSNPDGAKGWTHTANWVALELEDPAVVKITLERQQGVVVVNQNGVASAARFALTPALTLYNGWDETTEFEDHTFNNVGNFWSTIVYQGHATNPKARARVVYKARLPAGRYSIAVGGNPKSLGDAGAYPAAGCDPADAVCYGYTGLHGYRLTIQTR